IMAPSQVQIATSSLQRLLKEEKSYFKEQEQQEARIAKLENQAPGSTGDSDGNEEFQLKQE
ncbi:tubulin binding cofactor A, partial [Exophiala aquamarina CBS 119918]